MSPYPLPHRVVFVDQRRSAVAIDRNDDREANRRLGGGDGDHEKGEGGPLPGERRNECAEGDRRKVDGVEHQLDRHEHADRVSTSEEPEGSDREEDRGEGEVRLEVSCDRAHRATSSPSSSPGFGAVAR
jgi:hypothetical protein